VSRALCAALAFCLLPIAASAQTASGAGLDRTTIEQASQGPMIVERVHNGFLVAPEFKFTEVDKKSSGLAGGYAGVVFDEHFFIGGGGYVLATDRRGRDMAYGGLVLQWLAGTDTFGVSAKTLLGGGWTQSATAVQLLSGPTRFLNVRVDQNFFVAEPEVDALVRVTKHMRLAIGAGYRFTGLDRRGRLVPYSAVSGNDRLDGAVGSIGLQIGSGW
jgi:hypothetical protein